MVLDPRKDLKSALSFIQLPHLPIQSPFEPEMPRVYVQPQTYVILLQEGAEMSKGRGSEPQ